MDLFVVKLLAVLAVAALVGKRAIRGPQKQFARLSCAAVVTGLAILTLAEQQGDAVSWVAALLILGGMMVALVMVLVDMQWTVRTGLAAWKRKA